jgi:hypothetical protein
MRIIRVLPDPRPKLPGPSGILLDRNDAHATTRERNRDRSAARTDFDDQLARLKSRLIDQVIGSCSIKEILAETMSPPIPNCPPAGGHGRSP